MITWLLWGIVLFLTYFVAVYVCYDPQRYAGKLFRDQMKYAFMVAIVLVAVLFVCLLAHGDVWGVLKAIVLGAVLIMPACWWTKRWIARHIDGNRVFFKHRSRFLYALTFSLTLTPAMLFGLSVGIERLSKVTWILVGFGFSWVVAQAYILNRVIELENKLGEPIIQEVR